MAAPCSPYVRSTSEAASIEKSLLFGSRAAAHDRVAMGKAPESADDVGMSLRIAREFFFAAAARRILPEPVGRSCRAPECQPFFGRDRLLGIALAFLRHCIILTAPRTRSCLLCP